MRLAWIIYGSLTQPTGGYVYDRIVVEGLRARGHQVDIISLTHRGLARGFFSATKLAKQLDAYDLCVGDELCFAELSGAFLHTRARKVLLVHHLSCWEEPSFVKAAAKTIFERVLLFSSHQVIVTSHQTAARLAHDYGRANIIVAVPGADRLAQAERLPGRDRMLFVGTWTRRKGLHVLLQALALMADAPWHLSIVGDALRDLAYRQTVLPLIAALGTRVSVRGTLDEASLARVYAAHDVLVLPSFYEGYGMVLTEALHAGLRVVACDVGAVSEAVGASPYASLVPAGQPPLLAQALRVALKESGSPTVPAKSLPTWKETVERIEEALSSTA